MKHARRKRRKPNKSDLTAYLRYPAALFAAAVILFAGFPYIFSSIFSVPVPAASQQEETPDYLIDMPQTVKVYRTLTGKTETVDFEEYVKGVVAGEVPHTFKKEAMKAQAVAAGLIHWQEFFREIPPTTLPPLSAIRLTARYTGTKLSSKS